MRRVILLSAMIAVALALGTGVALAQVVNCPMAGGLCVGTPNNDTLYGSDSADEMRGLKGQDTLNAGVEFDVLHGGRGNDILRGEADADTLSGDLGNDKMNGGDGDDAYGFANGWGKDRIADNDIGMFGERLTFSLVTTPLKMDLTSSNSRPEVQSGVNTLDFGPNIAINEIDGSSSNDKIAGTNGSESLNGIQGNDTVGGRGSGDDVLGMDGKDRLFGGSGRDDIEAGNGADVIHADDNEGDSISCGGGNDTVFFDQNLDVLLPANACEDKRRR